MWSPRYLLKHQVEIEKRNWVLGLLNIKRLGCEEEPTKQTEKEQLKRKNTRLWGSLKVK